MNNQVYNPYANNNNVYTFTGNNQPQQNDTISVISISGGENSALNYMLRPNTSAFFLSADTSEMFLKGVDASGMINKFKAFDIKEKMPNYQTNLIGQAGDFATKEDVNNLSKEIQDLKKFLDDLTAPSTKG